MNMFQANADHPIARIFLEVAPLAALLPTGLCSFVNDYGLCYPERGSFADRAHSLLQNQIDEMYELRLKEGPLVYVGPNQYTSYPVEAALYEHSGRQASEVYHFTECKTDPSTPQGRLRRWWAHNLAVVASQLPIDI